MNGKNLLNRPEVVTLIVAVLVSVLGPLAVKAGVEIPEKSLALVVTVLWGLVGTSVYEGWKNPNYAHGLATLKGFKAVAAYAGVLLVLVQAGLKTVGVELSDAVVNDLVALLLGLMGLKANSDRNVE